MHRDGRTVLSDGGVMVAVQVCDRDHDLHFWRGVTVLQDRFFWGFTTDCYYVSGIVTNINELYITSSTTYTNYHVI